MLRNVLLGMVMLVVCTGIQCFVVAILLHVVTKAHRRVVQRPTLMTMTAVLTTVVLILVTGNVVQAVLWAGLFMGLGEFGDFATAFYASVVNFTTLGYGDMVMSEESRLLGAFEAGNGVLMLGLTTSVLFVVLNGSIVRMWGERVLHGDRAGQG